MRRHPAYHYITDTVEQTIPKAHNHCNPVICSTAYLSVVRATTTARLGTGRSK